MEAMIWIGLIILFVLVEIATVGLTSIWFGLADRRIFCGFPDSGGIYPAVGGEVFKAASDPDQLRAGNR